jgi:hypothetical protein
MSLKKTAGLTTGRLMTTRLKGNSIGATNSGRKGLWLCITMVGLIIGAGACTWPGSYEVRSGASTPATTTTAPTPTDAVGRRNVARADQFITWLGGEPGWVGEIGWPDDERWNNVADTVYRTYDQANVSVTAWEAADWWCPRTLPQDYAIYCAVGGDTLNTAYSSASVVERYPERSGVARGINLLGSEFGTCWGGRCNTGTGTGGWFSNVNRGAVGANPAAYKWPERADMAYLASRGVRTLRLPFRWERMQPALGGALDAGELGFARQAIADAGAEGLNVILTPFSWAAYWLHDDSCACGVRRPIGSAEVSSAHFSDLWTRLAREFGTASNVSFGLSGEPVAIPGGAGAWEQISRDAVTAIRRVTATTFVWVPTFNYSSVFTLFAQHPHGPWIDGPGIGWEAHHYFNDTGSGDYLTWEQELEAATRAGY